MIFRRAPEPPGPEADLLAVLGAVGVIPPAPGAYFAYGLVGHDGKTFYAGSSANILTRLGHWVKVYGDTIASVWLVKCEDELDMEVTEDFLIKRLKPAVNVRGRSDEEQLLLRKMRGRGANQRHGRAMGLAVAESRAADEAVSG